MKKEIPIFDLIDKYTYWLISKYILIAKRAKLILKQLAKMIIRNDTIFQKKSFFTKILYNWEAILIWNFTIMGKVKK